MRDRLLLLCAATTMLATGCYAPGYSDCAVTCASGHGCPSGLHCDEATHKCRVEHAGTQCGTVVDDAAPDVPPDPNDLDGDLVLNDVDNCPVVANPLQDDEDGDQKGDVCDPCPISAATNDFDQDGVGDLCDPDTQAGGDSIVMFESFRHGMPPALQAVCGGGAGATWTINPGAHTLDAIGAGQAMPCTATWPKPTSGTGFTVIAGINFFASMRPVDSRGGLFAQYAAFQGIACAEWNSTGGIRRQLIDTGDNTMSVPAVDTLQDGLTTMSETFTPPDGYHCRHEGGADVTFAFNRPIDRLGLYSTGMLGPVNWVMILKR